MYSRHVFVRQSGMEPVFFKTFNRFRIKPCCYLSTKKIVSTIVSMIGSLFVFILDHLNARSFIIHFICIISTYTYKLAHALLSQKELFGSLQNPENSSNCYSNIIMGWLKAFCYTNKRLILTHRNLFPNHAHERPQILKHLLDR